MQAICQNPFCGAEITVLPGHRPRKYCNSRCKSAAFRARKVEAERARLEAEQLAQNAREREALRRRFGDLLPETLDLLQRLSKQNRQLADQIGQAIKAERDQAQHTANEERNALVDEIMLNGEALNLPTILVLEDNGSEVGYEYTLDAGLASWSYGVTVASLERLRLVRDAVHCKMLAAAGRRRLARM
ncbi:MAG TPA: hypothetical protein VFB12_28785 [Ktedonobacteraceae bacterium]|nr:hypothetical protein [Ktedonobacteraceae bacterium]